MRRKKQKTVGKLELSPFSFFFKFLFILISSSFTLEEYPFLNLLLY